MVSLTSLRLVGASFTGLAAPKHQQRQTRFHAGFGAGTVLTVVGTSKMKQALQAGKNQSSNDSLKESLSTSLQSVWVIDPPIRIVVRIPHVVCKIKIQAKT